MDEFTFFEKMSSLCSSFRENFEQFSKYIFKKLPSINAKGIINLGVLVTYFYFRILF
jgi:hypothetical protein